MIIWFDSFDDRNTVAGYRVMPSYLNLAFAGYWSPDKGRWGSGCFACNDTWSNLAVDLPGGATNPVYVGFAYKQEKGQSSLAPLGEGLDWVSLFNFYATVENQGFRKVHMVNISPSGLLHFYDWDALHLDWDLVGVCSRPVRVGVYEYYEFRAGNGVVLRVEGVEEASVASVWIPETVAIGAGPSGTYQRRGLNGPICFDDFYIANSSGSVNNSFLSDVRLINHRPVGDGLKQWITTSGAGNHYTEIDDAIDAISMADKVLAQDVDKKDTYTLAQMSETNRTIKAVGLLWQASGRNRKMKPLTKLGATEAQGSEISINVCPEEPVFVRAPLDVDPNSNPWTVANFNSTEFGQVLTQ